MWETGTQYHVFSFWENPNPHELFPCSKILSFFLMFSLLVILRSCIASLKVLNYDLEGCLKKVYDCVRFIQTIPMVWASIAQIVAHDRLQYRHTNSGKLRHGPQFALICSLQK